MCKSTESFALDWSGVSRHQHSVYAHDDLQFDSVGTPLRRYWSGNPSIMSLPSRVTVVVPHRLRRETERRIWNWNLKALPEVVVCLVRVRGRTKEKGPAAGGSLWQQSQTCVAEAGTPPPPVWSLSMTVGIAQCRMTFRTPPSRGASCPVPTSTWGSTDSAFRMLRRLAPRAFLVSPGRTQFSEKGTWPRPQVHLFSRAGDHSPRSPPP